MDSIYLTLGVHHEIICILTKKKFGSCNKDLSLIEFKCEERVLKCFECICKTIVVLNFIVLYFRMLYYKKNSKNPTCCYKVLTLSLILFVIVNDICIHLLILIFATFYYNNSKTCVICLHV